MRISRKGLFLALVLWATAAEAQDVSHIKVGTLASNTSTTTANNYYSASTTSTREFWGPDPTANRPAELKELARALRYDVDLIYEYVHDNMRTVFMYGLQKGAHGAVIDQSGTSFDQAHLMIELLRESGYSARFKAGTVQMSTAQVNAWIGSSNTTALQQIFREGGIPLNYSSGNFTIGHIWVEVTIPGSSCNTTCWFDPSYKTHTFKTALNLESLMNWNANEFSTTYAPGFLMQAWSGLQQQGTPADPVWISNLNYPNIQTKLQGYATSLLTNLKSATHSAKEIEDVIGGQDIVKTGAAGLRNNGVLPGFPTISVQRTWDCVSSTQCGVPDAYRTKLTVHMVNNVTPFADLIVKALFVDEIYGRRLYFDTPLNIANGGPPGSLEPWCVKLTLDGQPISGAQTGCTGGTTPPPPGRLYQVRIEVDHPYAAGSPAGSYMDLSTATGTHIDKQADFILPVNIMHGWGDVSPALLSKLSAEQRTDRLLPVVDPQPADIDSYEPGNVRGDSAMDHTLTKLGASYLAQYSRMADLQQWLGNSVHVMHHMVGIAYVESDVQNGWAPASQFLTDNDWYLRDRALRINVDGAISVNSKSNTTADRQKVIHSTLAAAALLEGSIFEQMLDVLWVGSTATRFHWGSTSLAAMKFYLFRPTSPAPPGGLGSDFPALGCASNYYVPNGIPGYVNSTKGFWAIAAAEQCLGPGNKYGPNLQSVTMPSMERGGAFAAFKPDNSAVAHVVSYMEPISNGGRSFKGGGAAVAAEYAREFEATGAASLLKDKFEDRSRLHGVDLQSGELTYSAPADLSLGEGGFPYELAVQRTFKPGASSSPGLPEGWAHTLDVRASISGDGLAKLGTESAWAAAETIAALYTAQKIYSVMPTLNASTTPTMLRDHLKRWVLAPLVMNWWGTKLTQNVVTINAGHDARQFTRLADGAFYPPRNGVGTVTQAGARQMHLKQTQPENTYDYWDYSPVSFTYTAPEKDVQIFGYYEYENTYSAFQTFSEEATGRKHGWHLTGWTFPYGVNLTLTYQHLTPFGNCDPCEDRPVTVQNNLGRSLTFNYTTTVDGVNVTSLTDGPRTVQYGIGASGTLDTVTSPEGSNGAEISKYSYIGGGENPGSIPASSRPQIYPKLWKIFAPSDAIDPKLQVTYDRTWRVSEFKDAVAIKTPAQRGPWKFYVTGSNRGEREDSLDTPTESHEYTVYYDSRGRAIQLIDEADRLVSQVFDNHDRVTERSFPEGNKVQFAYDDSIHQVTQLTQVRKSSTYWTTAWANLVVGATYDPTCKKIKTVTDPKGKVTTWNYNTTTCTLTNVQQPQVQNPQSGGALTTPQTSFTYNGFGQMTQITDPTGRVVTFDYDATTKYRWHRYVDPAGLNLTTTYAHNTYGDISAVADPRGNQATYTFDKLRRLKQVDQPLSATTINRLDLDGDVYQVERAMNAAHTQWQIWHKSFTPTKKVFQETSPTSEVTSYAYDGVDRVDVVTDPEGRKTRTEYFRDGKTKKITKAYQSSSMTPIEYVTYTLTPSGQIDTVLDGNGNLTNLDYDGFDRLHRTFYAHATTGTVCTPALPHSTTPPSCGAGQAYEELSYDNNGNVTAKRNRSGQSLAFGFDDLNRETSRTVPANSLGHYVRALTSTYDLASRKWDSTVVESPLANQTISHRYDAAGRVDFVTDSYIGASNTTDYSYDAAGNRTVLAWPGGGSVAYTYDALNRMDAVTEGGITLADYDWDTLSRRDLVKFNNNGFTSDFGYESDDDLNSIVHSSPTSLTFTIGRNHAGQIASLTASDGAFLSRPGSTLSDAYSPNKLNQIASLNSTTFAHDANGNLTSDGTFTFEYDEENRLRSAVGGGTTAAYEYDPLGRRRAKVVNGVTTKFVADGEAEIEERDGTNNVLRRYVSGPAVDDHIALLDSSSCPSGGKCFLQTNWQGSTIALITQVNVLSATYHYGPYGEGTNWTPSDALTGNPFRYTGRRLDPETGLYHYRARYYSPRIGRFLQVDPSGPRDELNLFMYAGDDPINNRDPSGATCETDENDMATSCHFNQVRNKENLTREQLNQVAAAEKVYTDVTKALQADPDKEVELPVPKADSHGRKTTEMNTVKVKAGWLADRLVERYMVADPSNIAGDPAVTGPLAVDKFAFVGTTFNAGAFTGTSYFAIKNVSLALAQSIVFMHEAIHATPIDRQLRRGYSQTDWRGVHQDPYNIAVYRLLYGK